MPKLASLLEARNCFENLYSEQEKAVQLRQQTIDKLNEIAAELDKHHRNVNISKIVGSSVGTVGSGVAVAGAIAAPFTAGISLILGAVGGAVAALGGLVTGGAELTEIALKWDGLRTAQRAIDADKEQCDKLIKGWEKFKALSEDVVNKIEAGDEPKLFPLKRAWKKFQQWILEMKCEAARRFPKAWKAACFLWEGFCFIKQSGKLGWAAFRQVNSILDVVVIFVRGVEEALKKAPGGIAKALIKVIGTRWWMVLDGLFSAIGLVLDLYTLIKTAIDIHRGSHSDAAVKLREMVLDLEKEQLTWKEALA